jgi:hypothetical protein
MKSFRFGLKEGIFTSLALVVLFAMPILSFGKSGVLYVNDDAKGKEDGSYNHPYDTIGEALDKAHRGDEVRVQKGTYKENITIPGGVKLTSDADDRDKVTIKGKSDKKPTVTMRSGAELSAVTVKEGQHGIFIKQDDKAHIYNVTVKDAKYDGIHAEGARVDPSKALLIDTVYIARSGKAGVYAQKRYVTIIDSTIDSNGSDGIDLQAGVRGWIENTKSRWNGGSGAKFIVDGSSVWTKSSSFRYNRREGIEVSSYGGGGEAGIKKANIVGNGGYGIARLQRGSTFRGLEIGTGVNENYFSQNVKGTVSGIVPIH